jgi:uncharacterized SAM-binding protein YcdF (DUF218 family)
MFLFVSKTLGALLIASNALIVVALAGAIALLFGRKRLGTVLVGAATLGLVLFGWGPMGFILMRPLEDRFPRPPSDMPEPTGIIVLGGVVGAPTVPRRAIALSEDGERLSETATLAHRYPNARIIVSGGTFGSRSDADNEAFISKRFLMDLGIEESRIATEPRSLSTAENAAFTRELVMPQPGQRWLLVTSAAHMARAVGAFRRVGFPVIAYPVGYTTTGLPQDYGVIGLNASTNLARVDAAVHEWLGLIAYWLTGRTDALLPASEPGENGIFNDT